MKREESVLGTRDVCVEGICDVVIADAGRAARVNHRTWRAFQRRIEGRDAGESGRPTYTQNLHVKAGPC